MEDIAANLSQLRQRVAAACARAGRHPSAVEIVAVAKTHPSPVVREAANLGLTVFGENRVQEAKEKIPLCPGHLRWHLIGHLQSNKCRDAVRLFEMIESVDSLALAREIDKWADKQARAMPVLIEVNVAGESSKFGYAPDKLLAELKAINALPRIEIHGLMTVAPFTTVPERARPVFGRLRELKAECEQLLGAGLAQLSMGMTGDFEVAIEEGATIIRVGSAIFGARAGLKAGSDESGASSGAA